jgi:hypothetical protein
MMAPVDHQGCSRYEDPAWRMRLVRLVWRLVGARVLHIHIRAGLGSVLAAIAGLGYFTLALISNSTRRAILHDVPPLQQIHNCTNIHALGSALFKIERGFYLLCTHRPLWAAVIALFPIPSGWVLSFE